MIRRNWWGVVVLSPSRAEDRSTPISSVAKASLSELPGTVSPDGSDRDFIYRLARNRGRDCPRQPIHPLEGGPLRELPRRLGDRDCSPDEKARGA